MATPLLTRKDFPDVGDRRFFVLTHNPKSVLKPIRIELREALVEGRHVPSMSRLLGYDNTVADKERVIEVATEIEARVGRVDEIVGTY